MRPNWSYISHAASAAGKRSGFSLLELLVALTILAIALVPVAYFYTKSLQTVEEASIRTRALMLAQERIAELRQMPYNRIRSNITPSPEQLAMYGTGNSGPIDTTAADWYGYDFEGAGATWQAMFAYPLPLDYNPYRPQTQGYNNAVGVNHYAPNNPLGGVDDPQVNFNDGNAGGARDYEYEPIGFYSQKIFNHNRSLSGVDRRDIRMNDRRTISGIEPAELDPTSGSGTDAYDPFRTGTESQVDNYSIYGRRTIILDVLPDPLDLDGGDPGTTNRVVGTDGYAPEDDRDGSATAVNPYPLRKGPDNKFQMAATQGARGKLVIVQVFWLPRKAANTYIKASELNKIELRTFIAAGNQGSDMPSGAGDFNRNWQLDVSPTP
jgi:prepilin-type N-terminal cleavage/methylation domain-containing protein